MAMLLDVNIKLEKVCELLGRTWMSVDIKRGEFVPELMMWANSEGYSLTDGDSEGLIEEYLNDKKEIAKLNRASRSSSEKNKNKLVDKIRTLNKMLDSIDLRSRSGMVFPSDKEKIRATKEEIKDIEDELLEKYDVECCYIDGEMWYILDDE